MPLKTKIHINLARRLSSSSTANSLASTSHSNHIKGKGKKEQQTSHLPFTPFTMDHAIQIPPESTSRTLRDEQTCRFCKETSLSSSEKLIDPCNCKGSCKYVHESCLKVWIEQKKHEENFQPICELCNAEYYLTFFITHFFSKRKAKETLLSSLVCFLTWAVFIGIVIFLCVLISREDTIKTSYIVIIAFLCTGIILIIGVLVHRLWNCRENFCMPILIRWSILSCNGKKLFIDYLDKICGSIDKKRKENKARKEKESKQKDEKGKKLVQPCHNLLVMNRFPFVADPYVVFV